MPKTKDDQELERIENKPRTNFFEIEKRLTDLEATASQTALEEFKERLQELEDLQMLMQAENMQLRQKILGEAIEIPTVDIEKRIGKIEEVISKGISVEIPEEFEKRLMALEKGIVKGYEPKDLITVSKRFDDIEKRLKENQDYFNKKLSDLETVVEGSGKMLTEKGMKIFLDKIQAAKFDIEKKINEIESIKERLEKTLKEREDLIKKIDESEVNVTRADALFTKIRTQEEMIKFDIEKIESLKERIDSLIKDRVGEMNLIKEDVSSNIRSINKKMDANIEKNEALREDTNRIVKSFENKINDIRNELNEKTKNVNTKEIVDVNKKINILDEKTTNIVSLVKEFNEKLAELKTYGEITDKNLVGLTEKVNDNKKEFEKLTQTSVDLSKSIERINSVAEEFDQMKKLNTELNEKMKGLGDIKENTNSKIKDFEKRLNESTNKVNTVEDRLYNQSLKLLTDNLKKFADIVDEKFNKFLTKDDYEKIRQEYEKYKVSLKSDMVKEFSKNVSLTQVYNIEPLIKKISMLENQIKEMQDMIRGVYGRAPIIIE